MSSKFFTWTKGDRRNAAESVRSGGVVPIPVECLTIKGMDYARSAKGKNHRKPLPLPLIEPPNSATPPHSSRTNDSIALHDAAVQSATSLMAVMNDMLRSPQLSAHISSHHRSDLTPMYARPRSHTAPSTPLVEAPTLEPVELPGSQPLNLKKSHLSLPYSTKNASEPTLPRPHDPASFGASLIRPHSSPQEKQVSCFAAATSADDLTKIFEPAISTTSETPRCKSADPYGQCYHFGASTGSEIAEATLVGNDNASTTSSKRPSLSVVQPRRSVSPSIAGSVASSSHRGSSTIVPRITDAPTHIDLDDAESVLLDEISRLRASQDAHVRSLKEAHEKELACQRSYIAFLEKRRTANARSGTQQQQQQLTIDTSTSTSRIELHSEPSATTLKSFESCLDGHKRVSQEAVAENEALKRKLSLCRKAQVDAVEVRRERDHLRDAADRSDRRIVQLKDIIRKAKENEKTLRNQAANLEARLLEANNERTDVLEGFHDACSQVRTANDRERRLAQELDELQRQAPQLFEGPETFQPSADFQPAKPRHGRTVSDTGTWASTPPRMDPTMRQLIESRRMISAKEARIAELERAAVQASEPDSCQKAQQERISDLEARLQRQKLQLDAAQCDAERYNSLLHNELRRQAKRATQDSSKRPPQLEAQAFVVATEKLVRLRNRSGTASGHSGLSEVTSAPLPADNSAAALAVMLEQELDHCIKEIIMYKLDVKGYRKDLKKAHAEIDSLRAMSSKPPPTPDRESVSSVRSQRSGRVPSALPSENVTQARLPTPCDPGLGITLPQPPKTPKKLSSVAAATAAALSSPPLTSPPPRTQTPLNAYKKLPKPPVPSRTPSPLPSASRPKWPEQDVVRTETLRSLSESIISSYGKREQADPEMESAAPSSEPLGSLRSPRTPAQKGREGKVDSGYAA